VLGRGSTWLISWSVTLWTNMGRKWIGCGQSWNSDQSSSCRRLAKISGQKTPQPLVLSDSSEAMDQPSDMWSLLETMALEWLETVLGAVA
jgi:hypothetical protein